MDLGEHSQWPDARQFGSQGKAQQVGDVKCAQSAQTAGQGGPDMWESMCNPITQAMIMNKLNVDFAIMLGLCIGHDTLFLKYCRVPLTVLAVKDRVFGHNPMAALYLSGSYYRRLMTKEE